MPRRNRTQQHQPFVDKNTCQLKRKFISEKIALQASTLQELQSGEDLSVYKCERCSGWHLTRGKGTT